MQKLHWIINCIYFDIILQRRRVKRKISAEVEQRGRSREIEGKKEEVEGRMFSLCLISNTSAKVHLAGLCFS